MPARRRGFDGVAVLPGGRVLVSSHKDSSLHLLEDGALRPLLPRPPTPADIGFDLERGRVLIPSLGGDWVEIWALPAGLAAGADR